MSALPTGTTTPRKTRQLRVLTIVGNLQLGGTQRAAQNYATAYQQSGLISDVLALDEGGPRAAVLQRQGVEVFVGASGETSALLRRYDVVHIHGSGNYDGAFIELLRALRRANPTALIIETNVFSRPDYSPARHEIDLHLHLSEWGLAKWRSWTKAQNPRPLGATMPYLVNDCDISFLPKDELLAWRRELGIPPAAFVALRVGQPLSAKWSWHAFEAFQRFARDKSDAYFVTIGRPPEFDAAQGLGRRLVSIQARFDDSFLSTAYHASDVFLHSAQIGESFGMVLAEAALAEKPVITLSRPLNDNGQVEVVRHGVTGLVANNTDGLRQALDRLYADRTYAQSLGKRGRLHVVENFSATALMPKLMAIFEAGVGHSNSELRRLALRGAGWDQSAQLTEIDRSHEYLGQAPGLGMQVKSRLVHNPYAYEIYYKRKLKRMKAAALN